jgi:hypothetical protein
MSPSQNEGLLLKQWLDSQPRRLNDLLSHAHRLADINRALAQWSTEPWLAQVRVANIREGAVILFSSSAAALVPLRYRSQELLTWLNERFHLGCTRVETKVRPALPGR